MRTAAVAGALVVGLTLAVSGVALAHGAAPGPSQLLHDGDRLLVATHGSGLFVGREGGSWRWLCDEAMNRRADRTFARTGDGTLLVTDYLGVQYSRDGGCTFARGAGEIAVREPSALVADPVLPSRVWATTRSTGVPWNALFVSDDSGATWRVAWQGAEYLHGLALSDDARTIYLVGTELPGAPWPRLHLSHDGGQSFRTVALDGGVAPRAAAEMVPRAVDPADPSVLWLVADLGQVDALWRVAERPADGGDPAIVVTEVQSGMAIIGDLAFDRRDPGRPVMYVATRAGLLRSVDGGPLVRVGALEAVAWVDVAGGVVRACASTFPPDHAALARSDDGGDSFAPVMCLGDAVGPIAGCPPGSAADTLCPLAWAEAAPTFGAGCAPPPDGGVDLAAPADGGPAALDAGPGAAAPSGCSCDLARPSPSPPGPPWPSLLLLLLLTLTLARRHTPDTPVSGPPT